ncbi:NAD-dependent epimerase/dehydratase family protein [Solibacillus sp. CAU 1738]|uniref:NAD-dependent epimerase/dehydratase family protein n=1 Tax=Solibacillus sp. CAU 1738 TaxID=3140363 RepID=UPI0032600CDF
MKNILVLGGTRFFGRKLVELLIDQGHNVTIATRGQSANPFGDKVEHVTLDRAKKEQLEELMDNRTFDLVYDNICYSPNEAKAFCDVFNGKIGKLVFTSTLSTYEPNGVAKIEADFDPYSYDIRMGDTTDFTYSEGKRQAEAVFYKYAQFPVVAVRFPIVMGEDDYTERLHFHVKRVAQGEAIGFLNMDAEMSFIQATEAARFLAWAGEANIEGPYNATATGTISLRALMDLVEEATGKHAKISLVGNDDIRSPYAIPASWYMNNDKATEAGFDFTDLTSWLANLVRNIAKQYA